MTTETLPMRVSRTVVIGREVHWCPRSGVSWRCPTCGRLFTRLSETLSWRTAS